MWLFPPHFVMVWLQSVFREPKPCLKLAFVFLFSYSFSKKYLRSCYVKHYLLSIWTSGSFLSSCSQDPLGCKPGVLFKTRLTWVNLLPMDSFPTSEPGTLCDTSPSLKCNSISWYGCIPHSGNNFGMTKFLGWKSRDSVSFIFSAVSTVSGTWKGNF